MGDQSNRSEFELIDAIRRGLPAEAAGVVVGSGDDAAVLDAGGRQVLVTTDTMVEGVHFRFDWSSHADVGRKAAATNLSDIGAMGGRSRWAVVAASLPAGYRDADVEAFVAGFRERLEAAGAALVGGDLTRSPGPWVLTVTLLGLAPEAGPLRRDAARPGDTIWIAGTLGDAALALRRLEAGERPPNTREPPWRALQAPSPPLAFAAALGESGRAHAAIDLSDGLVQDLGHVCRASGVAAEVALDRLPTSAVFRHFFGPGRGGDPWPLAAAGGEDYALLFTAPAEAEPALRQLLADSGDDVPLAAVGRIVAGDPAVRLTLDGAPYTLERGGWDHFG